MAAPRIAVVGAGLAGLSAAVRAHERGSEVMVFEARERVGGRVWSESVESSLGSAVVERGAEFVLDGYEEMSRLLTTFGLSLADTGMSYYVRELAETPHITTDNIARAGQRAAEVARTLSGGPMAEDALAVLDEEPALVEALRARIEISAAAPSHLVAASALEHVASFEPQPSWRVSGGNQRLPDALARVLGDAVRLGEVVRAVSDDGYRTTVYTSAGEASFDAVVVAVPLEVVRDPSAIDLSLPEWKRGPLSRVLQGHASKLHLPLSARPGTTAVMSVEDRFWNWTALDGNGQVAPVLNGFMGSEPAISRFQGADDSAAWVNATRRMRADLVFDDESGPMTTVWGTDQYARGAYSAPSPNLTDDDVAVLEMPVGSIHFAGEYCEPEFTGLMEGAIRSGERAADRILDASRMSGQTTITTGAQR